MPSYIFQGGTGFSLNAPFFFGFAFCVFFGVGTIILLLCSIFAEKNRIISWQHAFISLASLPAVYIMLFSIWIFRS